MTGVGRVRAVIVDDEPAARAVVQMMLADHPEVEVVGEATNGRDAIALIRQLAPDLLFLDVQMPDADGFAVLEGLGDDVPRGVVFVTAHDEHALRAFEVHALDYLLKPFGRQRFTAAVTRSLERLHVPQASTLRATLASMTGDRRATQAGARELSGEATVARADPPRRIGVRNGAKVTVIDVETIDWVEADGDYARIHAAKQVFLVSQRMNDLERLLQSAGFIRIHRSVIVRADRVYELHRDADGGGFIVLKDGVRLRVARGRWDGLAHALGVEDC